MDNMGNNAAKMSYYALLAESDQEEVKNCEVSLVVAGLDDGCNHNSELHVMKYKEAINGTDGEAWKHEVKNEYEQIINHKVYRLVKNI